MADGALLLGMMVGLAAVAGEAEGSGRLQPLHRALRVALIAGLVRVDRRCVGLEDLCGAVTGGALTPGGVMVLMTSDARRRGRFRHQGHPRGVALDARELAVVFVLERDLP